MMDLMVIGSDMKLNFGGAVQISKKIMNDTFDIITLEGEITSDLQLHSFIFYNSSALSFSLTLNYANVTELNCSV